MMPWSASLPEQLAFWVIWAGLLLAALVLVFRAGGERLIRADQDA